MEMIHKLLCKRPRFEIASVDSNGNEQIRIYGLREFGNKLEEISMDRRGFVKLSMFAHIAATTLAGASRTLAAEDIERYASLPKEKVMTTIGKLVEIDEKEQVICLKENEESDKICLKISSETEIQGKDGATSLKGLKIGDVVTIRYVISPFGEKRALGVYSQGTKMANQIAGIAYTEPVKQTSKPLKQTSKPAVTRPAKNCGASTSRCA